MPKTVEPAEFSKAPRVARLATVLFALNHQLAQQIEDLIRFGFEVTAIGSPQGDWEGLKRIKELRVIPVSIERGPNPVSDIGAIIKLWLLFRRERFDVVHSTTPKGGLVAAIAARVAGVPIRLHTFTGQTWATKAGFFRRVLIWMDKIIVALNTQCYADSLSQRDYLLRHGVGRSKRIKVLGEGSLAGVNLDRFCSTNWKAHRGQIRCEIGVPDGDFVIAFIGRVTKEKGIGELLQAFQSLCERHDNVHLLLIGPIEDNDIEAKVRGLTCLSRLHVLGPTAVPEKFLSISELLCLPSYREGFGTVVIEAAAMGVPTVGTNIVGLREAIVPNKTGLLVDPRDPRALESALESLVIRPDFCRRLGMAAYERCVSKFDSREMSRRVAAEYDSFIESRCS